MSFYWRELLYIVNVRLKCICPGGGWVYWKNIYVNKSWKNETQTTFRGFLLFLNKRGLSTGWKMFSESKLGPLISFSWPLLKLKPQISPGCYGASWSAYYPRQGFFMEGGKGVRVKGGLGHNSSRDVSQLPTLRMQRKTGRGAVLSQKVLMCFHYWQ